MVIFDLDGTLWETEKITYKTVNAVLKKYEPDKEVTMEVIKSAMGTNFEKSAELYMPYYDKEKREKILGEMLNLNTTILSEFGGNVYKNLKTTLDRLIKKHKLAIVSNCGGEYIEAFLQSSKLTFRPIFSTSCRRTKYSIFSFKISLYVFGLPILSSNFVFSSALISKLLICSIFFS
jgi:phosphoglycolate phosphatase-like HAD superfamily hydrolase